MQRKERMTIRLVINALLVAIYVVLSTMLVIQLGAFKITFEHFPVILCAVLFGPVDAMIVGGLGELFNQLTTFGLTPTTVLWVLPIVFRGASMGVCSKVLKKQMQNHSIVFMLVCVITGIFSSCFNTFALYVDSKLFGYYSYALVFGALFVRILLGAFTSVGIAICIKYVLQALKKTNFI